MIKITAENYVVLFETIRPIASLSRIYGSITSYLLQVSCESNREEKDSIYIVTNLGCSTT